MIDLIVLIKSLLLAWIVTRFEPLKIIVEVLPDKLIYNVIKLLLTCSKCCTFWLSLIIYRDLYTAILASLLMTIIEKYILERIEQITFDHRK
jgi:hypothetical protein